MVTKYHFYFCFCGKLARLKFTFVHALLTALRFLCRFFPICCTFWTFWPFSSAIGVLYRTFSHKMLSLFAIFLSRLAFFILPTRTELQNYLDRSRSFILNWKSWMPYSLKSFRLILLLWRFCCSLVFHNSHHIYIWSRRPFLPWQSPNIV